MPKNKVSQLAALLPQVLTGVGLLTGCGSSGGPSNAEPKAPEKTAQLLELGTMAPLFSLMDERGQLVNLVDFRGKKNVVLVFYPGDDTPGCTRQLCAIRNDIGDFRASGVAAFGVNPQDAKSHIAFSEKNAFPFPLLVDRDSKVGEAYGVRESGKTQRTVYGIDKTGKIVFARRGMPSDAEILAAFR